MTANRWHVKFRNLQDAQNAWEQAMDAMEKAQREAEVAKSTLQRMRREWREAILRARSEGYQQGVDDSLVGFK